MLLKVLWVFFPRQFEQARLEGHLRERALIAAWLRATAYAAHQKEGGPGKSPSGHILDLTAECLDRADHITALEESKHPLWAEFFRQF
jgi:hypothetical protein